MKLLFKQRLFSWFDSYDIYDEAGNTVYVVKGALAWGKLLNIYDANGTLLGSVKQRIFSWLPTFEMYLGEKYIGNIQKEFSFFKPKFSIDYKGWLVDGNYWEWDYGITDSFGHPVATISKELWNWTDTYTVDVRDPKHALSALMLVLAIDAEKCSNDD